MLYGNKIEGLILPQVKKEIEVGKLRDKMLILRQEIKQITDKAERTKKVRELSIVTAEYKKHRQTPFNFYGASGTSKTMGTLKALTKAGIPTIILETSVMSDASNITGVMLKENEPKHPGVVTTKYTKPYFIPLPVVDENGMYVLRNDGGVMWDYESLGYRLANYDEMYVHYEGDINQAPMYAILLDDFNKTASADVKAALFGVLNIIDTKAFNGYLMPNFLISTSGNPESFEYSTNGTMDDTAFASRLIHVRVLSDVSSVAEQVTEMNLRGDVSQVIAKMPELGVPEEDVESADYRPAMSNSLRAIALFNTVAGLYENDKDALLVSLAGIFGHEQALEISRHLETKIEIPTVEEIVKDYPSVQKQLKSIIDANENGIVSSVVENFKALTKETKATLEAYELEKNVENMINFMLDLPQTFRVDIIMSVTNAEIQREVNFSSMFSRNKRFLEIFKQEHALIKEAAKVAKEKGQEETSSVATE